MSTQQELTSFIKNLDAVAEGYKSWGKVQVLRIAVRDGERLYFTPAGNLAGEIKETEADRPGDAPGAEEQLLRAIFQKRKNVNCIFVTHQEYASALKQEVPPILDDQAQMLGVTIRIADVSHYSAATSRILSALSGRYAAVCSDGRCICIGGNIDDTYSTVQLLEKTSKAFTEAKYIGGAVAINKLEAWAMKMYFQFKYAKEASKNK